MSPGDYAVDFTGKLYNCDQLGTNEGPTTEAFNKKLEFVCHTETETSVFAVVMLVLTFLVLLTSIALCKAHYSKSRRKHELQMQLVALDPSAANAAEVIEVADRARGGGPMSDA